MKMQFFLLTYTFIHDIKKKVPGKLPVYYIKSGV